MFRPTIGGLWHWVNTKLPPGTAAQDHNCDFDHKGKGREILAKNNPNISIKGHESWSARRLKTTDFYWIRLKSWTNVCYICIIYIYVYGDRSKGPCKDFKLRKPCMLCWKPSRKCFFEFAKETFFSRKFRESWIS